MPEYGVDVGIGQPSMRYIPVDTKLSPSDTNATDKVIVQGAPLKYAREGASGLGKYVALCADGERPELVSTQRQSIAKAPVGCIDLPLTDELTGNFQLDLPYTGSVPVGKELSVLAAGPQTWKIVAAALATLNTGVVGSNNAITWLARNPGVEGNAIQIALIDPPGNNVALSVDVVGNTINVTLATDGASAITSTAAQVIAALRAHAQANAMVEVAHTGASTGAGVVAAVAATPLEGGEARGVGRVLVAAGGKMTVQF